MVKEGSVNNCPDSLMVDIVIATIGRPTLEVAITSALNQTHPHTRCVVIGDGPQPQARAIASAFGDRLLYLETPRPLRRAGNGVKEFWYSSGECSPFFRYLDDDDWLPPMSVAVQVAPMLDPQVVIAVCQMHMIVWDADGVVKERALSGLTRVGQLGNGSVLVRKTAVRGLKYVDRLYSDFYWIKDIMTRGRTVLLPHELYWYNQRRLHGRAVIAHQRAEIPNA